MGGTLRTVWEFQAEGGMFKQPQVSTGFVHWANDKEVSNF